MDATFILDTCVLSESSKARPHAAVLEFFRKAHNILIPAGALMELQLGITNICATDPIKAVKLSAWYQKLTAGQIPIVDTNRQISEVWGTLAADPRLRHLGECQPASKRPSGRQDLHIAAAALISNAAIATFNVRDFILIDERYPLPGIYDPLNDMWHSRQTVDPDRPQRARSREKAPPPLDPAPNGSVEHHRLAQ